MNKFLYLFFVFFVTISCLLSNQVTAQINIQNLSSINVDQLSDQQIIQLLQQAEANGLTENQLLQKAQSQGMQNAQLQKLQTRIAALRRKDSVNDRQTSSYGRGLNFTPDSLRDTVKINMNMFDVLKPKVYGADLFKNRRNTFEPNLKLATPINYVIGPDDQLNIEVYGSSLVNWNLTVTAEGNINIPGVGILNVGGKSVETATALIKSRLAANNYAIGRGTNVQVSLGNIRSIKVIMVGQLVQPGTYTLPSLATVFNALSAAGGPNDQGSLREIEVIRNNRIIRKLDVYDFLVRGSQKDNIALRDQDVIRIPTYKKRVEMAGQVKIPALFEVLPGEHLQDVINFAGGFTDSAYTKRITVSQISNQQRKLTDVIEANFSSYTPSRGDRYFVRSVINRFENRVVITGAVFRPGEYELQSGLTVAKLIENAAGLKEDAFKSRGTITRLKTDNSTEILSFNVNGLTNPANNILLQREDSVRVYSIFDLREKYNITINGSVRKPGTFAFADSMNVEDLILKAGGFTEGASPKRIEVARRIDNSDPRSAKSRVAQVFTVDVDRQLKLDKINFVLKPFDIVSIYNLPGFEKQRTLKVEGEVLYPGVYTIQTKNEKVSDIIARAGGLTASADVAGGSLKRDNAVILGVDKNKLDSAAIEREKIEKANRLITSYRDTTTAETVQVRNNYVGINLERILKEPGSNADILVENGDVLRVPKLQQIVRVNGKVLYPSAVVYSRSKSFNDYVYGAGGYSQDASKRRAYVVYPNGTVKGTRKFLFFNNHPSVKPGSEIFVPQHPPKEKLGIQGIVGLSTAVASLAAILVTLLRN